MNLYKPIKTESLPLFALEDLASNKAYTIGRRGTWRDYVDMYYLLTDGGLKLEQVISEAKERFGDEFSEKLFLEQLVYTEDLGEMDVDLLDGEFEPRKMVAYFERMAGEMAGKLW